MSQQPEWEVVYTTDSEQLRVDKTGVYTPELEYADCVHEPNAADDWDEDKARYEVFTVQLDQLTLDERGRLVDCVDANGVAHAPWFEDDNHVTGCASTERDRYCETCRGWVSSNLSAVARSCGIDPAELRKQFCDPDPKVRTNAYSVVANYHGWNNFDDYPLELTGAELDERWK
jgi:hypothetical protein